MKTTVDINGVLLANANANVKALAARQRISVTRLMEEGLALRLRAVETATLTKAIKIPVSKGCIGMEQGADQSSKKSMLDAADHDP